MKKLRTEILFESSGSSFAVGGRIDGNTGLFTEKDCFVHLYNPLGAIY